jgi:hypothetical protein
MLKGGSAYRIITDHLGSVKLVIDATLDDLREDLDAENDNGLDGA